MSLKYLSILWSNLRRFRIQVSGKQNNNFGVCRNTDSIPILPWAAHKSNSSGSSGQYRMPFRLGKGICKIRHNGFDSCKNTVLLSEFLSCTVIVNHLPRESSWEIKLTDRLSREKSTTSQDRKLIQSFQKRSLPLAFRNWMKNPSENWDLPRMIMSEIYH